MEVADCTYAEFFDAESVLCESVTARRDRFFSRVMPDDAGTATAMRSLRISCLIPEEITNIGFSPGVAGGEPLALSALAGDRVFRKLGIDCIMLEHEMLMMVSVPPCCDRQLFFKKRY